jgi:Flp pilus assembly pilin Flp
MGNAQGAGSRFASRWLSAGVFVMALRMAMGERLSAMPRRIGEDGGMAVVEYILLLSVGVVAFLAILQALTGSVTAFAGRVIKNIDSLN